MTGTISVGRLSVDDVDELVARTKAFANEQRGTKIMAPDPDIVLGAALWGGREAKGFRMTTADLRPLEESALRVLLWKEYWWARADKVEIDGEWVEITQSEEAP